MHLKLFNRKNDIKNSILILGMLSIEGSTIAEIDDKGRHKLLLSYSHNGTWKDSLGNEWTSFEVRDGTPIESVWPDHAQASIVDVDIQKDFMVEKDSGNHETFQRVFSRLNKGFMKTADPSKPSFKCKGCYSDLTKRNSISREYIDKDEGPSRFGSGHYDVEGDYEPDGYVNLSDGRYDNVDGSDTCGDCGEVVG